MELIKTQNVIVDNVVFHEPLQHLSYTWTFNPINGALRSGTSSGQIHLINNDRLVELLFSWEDIVEDSYEEALRLRNYQMISLPFRSKYIRFHDVWVKDFSGLINSNYTSDYNGLFKDVLFEDYASLSFLWG